MAKGVEIRTREATRLPRQGVEKVMSRAIKRHLVRFLVEDRSPVRYIGNVEFEAGSEATGSKKRFVEVSE